MSIRALFGRHCSDTKFRHDLEMKKIQAQKSARAASVQTHTTESSEEPTGPEKSSSIPERSRGSLELGEDGRPRPFPRDRKGLDSQNPRGRQNESPPQEIVSKSPGSQSQSLRRKLILQDLEESRQAKRAKLAQIDGPSSALLDSRTVIDSTNSPKDLDAVSPSVAGGQSDLEQGNPEEWSDEDQTYVDHNTEEQRGYMESCTFFDPEDKVQRCLSCHYELQSLMGMCENCEEDVEPSYLEVHDPNLSARPDYVFTNVDEECMSENDRLKYVGDYLDAGSSAYDSFDEDAELREEYEVNSFIDDASEKSDTDEEEEIDRETEDIYIDWEARFKELKEEHEALVESNASLSSNHHIVLNALVETEDKYHDLLDEIGLPHSSDEDDDDENDGIDEEMDEEGNLLVTHPAPPVPAVHEVVLSTAQDAQSQNSDEVEGERLQDITLQSTHNHTEPEIEL